MEEIYLLIFSWQTYFNKGSLSDEIFAVINDDVCSENDSCNTANVLNLLDASTIEEENTKSILRKYNAIERKKSKKPDKTDNQNEENENVCICLSHSATIQNTVIFLCKILSKL